MEGAGAIEGEAIVKHQPHVFHICPGTLILASRDALMCRALGGVQVRVRDRCVVMDEAPRRVGVKVKAGFRFNLGGVGCGCFGRDSIED